jgi:hypothetical protein
MSPESIGSFYPPDRRFDSEQFCGPHSYQQWNSPAHSLSCDEPMASKICIQNQYGCRDFPSGRCYILFCGHFNNHFSDSESCQNKSSEQPESRLTISSITP